MDATDATINLWRTDLKAELPFEPIFKPVLPSVRTTVTRRNGRLPLVHALHEITLCARVPVQGVHARSECMPSWKERGGRGGGTAILSADPLQDKKLSANIPLPGSKQIPIR